VVLVSAVLSGALGLYYPPLLILVASCVGWWLGRRLVLDGAGPASRGATMVAMLGVLAVGYLTFFAALSIWRTPTRLGADGQMLECVGLGLMVGGGAGWLAVAMASRIWRELVTRALRFAVLLAISMVLVGFAALALGATVEVVRWNGSGSLVDLALGGSLSALALMPILVLLTSACGALSAWAQPTPAPVAAEPPEAASPEAAGRSVAE